MAQSGFTPIQIYRTTTAAAIPTAGNLAAGELGINLTDEKLYFKNAAGTVKLLASNSGSLGSVTSVDVSGGTTGLTTSGGPITSSGTITLAGTLGVANGGTGTATAFTAGSVVFAGASGVYTQDNANLFWDNANDRLGIGTATPGYKLQAVSAGAGASEIVASNTAGGERIHLISRNSAGISYAQSQNSQLLVGTFDNFALQFMVNNTTRMLVDTSGNVGIGTSSPGARIAVAAANTAVASRGTAYLYSTNSMAANLGGQLSLGGSFTGTSETIFGSIAGRKENGTDNDIGGYLQFSTTNVALGNVERMRIDSSGNVGIGTSSPGYRLTINDPGTGQGFSNAGGGSFNIGLLAGTGSPLAYLFQRANSDLIIGTNNTERMRIDSSGNVGIGTSTRLGTNETLSVSAISTFDGMWVKNLAAAATTSVIWNAATAGDNAFMAFGTEATITGRGSITYNRAGGLVAYNTTSDYRAKDIIGPVTDAGATIDALKVYDGKMHGATVIRPMLIAHEAQEVVPYAVTGEKDAVNEDGTDKHQQMDVSSLVPLLIAELQSLRARVAQLEGN